MQCLEVEQGGRHHHGNDSTKTGNEYDSIYLHHIGTVLIYIYMVSASLAHTKWTQLRTQDSDSLVHTKLTQLYTHSLGGWGGAS